MFSRIAGAAIKQQAKQMPRAMFTLPKAGLRTSKFQPSIVSFKKSSSLPLFAAAPRSFHSAPIALSSSTPNKNPFEKMDASNLVTMTNECVAKLQNASTQQLYHWSSYGLAGLTPIALVLSPSFINFPVDFALGLIIPVHMHIGLVGIAEDYVPRSQQGVARLVLAVLSVLTAVGLLKVNLCGAGITESVKCLWREPKQIKAPKKE